MSDDLDLRGIDQRHEPDPQFRAALHSRLVAIETGTDPGSVTEAPDLAMIDLERASEKRERSRNGRRMARVILAVAAVVAIVVVATREVDVETPAAAPSLAPAVDPLVDIRARLVNSGDIELFTVSTDTPRYLGLTSLATFDGTRWLPMAEDLRSADGPLADAPAGSETVVQNISIGRLANQLVPAARTPTSAVSGGGRSLLWANTAGALFVDGGLEAGFKYQVTSADSDPSPDALRQATVNGADPVYYTLPDSVPNEIRALAQQVTAQATTPYDQARALQDWFRANFMYSLDVQRGHSNDAMINFLSIRKGYCEQFSGTFAAMARSLGLPTRVVVGFTPGQLLADGLYHVAGRDAHAWDEVWFDGYGWVLFDPTPGRGAPGAEQHTGAAAAQQAAT
jgi:transglutaminase-like putative cysteine protease